MRAMIATSLSEILTTLCEVLRKTFKAKVMPPHHQHQVAL